MKIKLVLLTFTLVLTMLNNRGLTQNNLDETDKIATYIKVWGFLKYYHPEVAKGELDWDKSFQTGIETILTLNTKAELNTFYLLLINDLGKVKKCRRCKILVPDSLDRNLNLDWLRDSSNFSAPVMNALQNIHKNRNQKDNFYVQPVRWVSNTSFANEIIYEDSTYPSHAFRLLSLARYWNIINYFYPYKYLADQNWNDVLIEMVPRFKNAQDKKTYRLSLMAMVARINDSHGIFYNTDNFYVFGDKIAPFGFKIIDDKCVVTSYYNYSNCQMQDIQIGDVFLSIDGQSISEIMEEKGRYFSASNEAVKRRNTKYYLFHGDTDSCVVLMDRNGSITEKVIYRDVPFNFVTNPHLIYADTFTILENNVGYIDLGLLQTDQVDEAMDSLKDTKAIIFDVRNYPNGTMYKLARFLTYKPKPFVKFTKPNLKYPGTFKEIRPYYCGSRRKKTYQGKVIILFDESTQSHAEFTVMALQVAKSATCIGSQTAGADGNVSLITLPGNFRTYMTGLGVYYPDGSETQRIGMVPDIVVEPTIEGIRSGRDEVLEKALEKLRIN